MPSPVAFTVARMSSSVSGVCFLRTSLHFFVMTALEYHSQVILRRDEVWMRRVLSSISSC